MRHYTQLTWAFLRIGAVSFGGLGATLALIERELVVRHGTASRADIAEALTHTKLLPGSTVVQIVAYLGWRLGGWPGSAAATVAFLLPSAVLMCVLAYGYAHVASLSAIASIRRGVLAVVIALLLGTMFRLSAQIVTTPSARAIAVGAFVAAGTLPIASPWVLVIAGLIGLMTYRERPR